MSTNKKHIILFASLVVLLVQNNSFAQQLNYTLNRDYLWGYDNYFNNKEENVQTFVKPYRQEQLNKVKDSTVAFQPLLIEEKIKTWLLKKIYPGNQFEKNKAKKFSLTVLPLKNTEFGYQNKPNFRDVRDITIGIAIMADIGKKLSFSFKVLPGEGVSNVLSDSIIHSFGVVPGLGESHSNPKHYRRYSYNFYAGYISYSPNKFFNFQIGRDKHFWGDGYRSLFLSDVSAPYPFLKITTNVWKFTYVNLYTIMKGATTPSGEPQDWQTKYSSFHYLGFNATKRINIGLFGAVVWQGTTPNRNRGFDINYLNPVIFFRPTEFSLGSSDNALMGASYKIKLFTKQQLYGQLLIDDLLIHALLARNGWWANKYGIQTGFKSFDVFKIKRLNFQTEFNYVRPYTYSYGPNVLQNYSNYNQPLAHPLGANFVELATFLNYRYQHFFFEGKCVYAVYGADTVNSDYGQNIFIPYTQHSNDYGNTTTQGIKTTLINLSLRGSYIVAPKINFKIELGAEYRIQQNEFGKSQTPYVYFGLRTDLCNLYNDF
jgi:hypothetical protein